MSSNNSLSSQLSHINLHHENAVNISNAFLKAITSQEKEISVDIQNTDGTISTIQIPSNIHLSHELSRLVQSFQHITGLSDKQSVIVSNDNSFRQIFVSSHRKAYSAIEASDIIVDDAIKLSTNAIVEKLLSPLTEVEFTLPEQYNRSLSTRITKLLVDDGDFSIFSENMTYMQAKQLLLANNMTYHEVEYDVQRQSIRSRYFGDFNVISATTNATASQIVIELDKLAYSDELNVIFDSKQLDINDQLTTIDGSLRLSVQSIDIKTKKITCNILAGVGAVNIGTKQLSILSVGDISSKVRIPVRLQEKSLIFISPVEPLSGFASAKSTAKLFDSTLFKVNANGDSYSFDEYFSSKVADIGAYFESIIRESIIPASLGEKPNRPELAPQDFNVLQVNTHLTNTPTVKKLQNLQKEKDVILSQIGALNASIAELNTKISQGNYSTDAKRSSDAALVNVKINEKLQKTSLLNSIVTDISTALNNQAEKSIAPKYRVRGFWPVQTDIPSSVTNPQKIVQYQARYRYVSNTGNTANTSQVTYTEGDNQISAIFSPWVLVKTEPLERNINKDGLVTWTVNSPTDGNQLNINQIDIPIQYGESVELQVRAISEAGYPTSPVMSDWSALQRIDFPESLLQESDIAAIQRKNYEDLMQVRILQEFSTQGVTKHISESINEQDKYFAHDASKIASGKVTAEQKIVSQFEYNNILTNRILFLEEIVNKRFASVAVQILDESLQVYDVNNFSTIKLFAGYYTDDVDLTETENYGAIIAKTFYLRLINRNSQTVELLSISPGSLIQNAQSVLYNNVPMLLSGSNEVYPQKNGQIIYNRNVDINGTVELYNAINESSATTVSESDIDTSAIETLKNVVHLNSGLIEAVKLVDSPSLETYVAMTKNHPSYKAFLSTADNEPLLAEFDRIAKFNDKHRSPDIQNTLSEDFIMKFEPDDQYLVGQHSVGAALYMTMNSLPSFQVNGIDAGSSKEIYSGEQDSVLIPIIFQYRMTDALGNPNGLSSLSSNSNFTYSKKIGFDLLIAGNKFTFDVQVTSKFRPTSVSTNMLGLQTFAPINQITTPNVQS